VLAEVRRPMNIRIIPIFMLVSLVSFNMAWAQGIEAGSWGGKVRSGPGTNYQQVGSLQNGDPVRLLEDTRVMMNGYPWHRISYDGGKIGYQWGGILCGFGNRIGGVFEICDHDNRPRKSTSPQAGQTCPNEGAIRSVTGDTSTSIQFKVVGENDETQFRIYWLDYEGNRKFYKHVFAGDVHNQPTFMTHPWLVTAPIPGGGEDCIAIYLPQRNGSTIVLD